LVLAAEEVEKTHRGKLPLVQAHKLPSSSDICSPLLFLNYYNLKYMEKVTSQPKRYESFQFPLGIGNNYKEG